MCLCISGLGHFQAENLHSPPATPTEVGRRVRAPSQVDAPRTRADTSAALLRLIAASKICFKTNAHSQVLLTVLHFDHPLVKTNGGNVIVDFWALIFRAQHGGRRMITCLFLA
jgi:hypothetical protein